MCLLGVFDYKVRKEPSQTSPIDSDVPLFFLILHNIIILDIH